jgi:large subunit ribosomal protein L17
LKQKDAVKELFGDIAVKIANRPGGYLRILKTGNRLGDNAEMAMIEFVDYNENLLKDASEKKTKTRRSRSKKSAAAEETVATEAPAAEA